MNWVFLFLLIISHIHCAEDIDPFSLLNATSSPVSKVFRGVNVITGDFVDNQTVDVVSGPDPYIISTSYCSSNIAEGTLADGWDFLHPSELELYMPKGMPYKPKGPAYQPPDMRAKITYREPGGGFVRFIGDEQGHKFKPDLKNVGYTLGGSNASHLSLYNVDIEMQHHAKQFVVTLGDGTKRIYELARKPKLCILSEYEQHAYVSAGYHITEERLPSGRTRQYKYDDDDFLTCIKTKSDKHTVHTISFHKTKDKDIVVTTSDNHTIRFHTEKVTNQEEDKRRVVTGIYPHGTYPLYYRYDERSPRHIRRVETIKRPDGAEVTLSYYREGKNYVGHEKVDPSKKGAAFLKGRVKTITTKIEPGRTERVKFFYDRIKRTTMAVTDLGKHIFEWDSDDRLVETRLTSCSDVLVQCEKYHWDDKGFLTTRVLKDESEQTLLIRKYQYDDRGNLTTEKVYGHWTGKNSKSYDCFTTTRTYSKDGFNLLLKQTDSEGGLTQYEYVPGTNLIAALFEGKDDTILKRTYYDYEDGILVHVKTDDGSSVHRHKKHDVTFCTFKKIVPKTSSPHFGAPLEERDYTIVSGTIYPIKTTRFHRDSQGLVYKQEEFGNDGKRIATNSTKYDDYDRPIVSIDALGNQTSIVYDSLGRVVEKRGPLPGHSFAYKYDYLGRVVQDVERWPDKQQFVTIKAYDSYGRVVRIRDFRGRTTATSYDLLGRPTKIIAPLVNGTHPTTTYQYKGCTQVEKNPVGDITTTKRSTFGSALRVQRPDSATTNYAYDAYGRVVEEELPSGLITKTTYDAFGRPTSIRQYADSKLYSETTKKYSCFFLLKEKAPSGLVTSISYDSCGRKIRMDMSGRVSTYSYDNANRLKKETHPDGTSSIFSYDALGRVVGEKKKGSTLLSQVIKRYDCLGRVVELSVVTDQGLAKTKSTFLPNGLPLSVTDPLGHKTTFTYEFGKEFVKKSFDARGVVTRELLDPLDRHIQTKIFDRMGGIIYDRSIRYDEASRPIRYEDKVIGGLDETIITEQSYHEGNLVRLTFAKGTPNESSSIYEYNRSSQKISESKPSGVKLKFKYDPKGRLSEQTSSDKSINHRFTYDSSDRCIEADDTLAGKKVVRSYNIFGEMTSEKIDVLTFESTYNEFGGCSQRTLPDHSTINYSYQDGRLSSIKRNEYKAKILSRSFNGRITSLELPHDAGTVKFQYDLLGRMVKTSHPQYCETRDQFDPAGNLLARTVNGTPEHFSYDDLNQLSSEPSATYRYDSMNRRVERSGISYQHNALNQMISVGEQALTYDTDGRRTHHDNAQYTYDALDRLISVVTDLTKCTYGYDAFHRRLWKKVTDLSGDEISFERFMYFGDNEVGTYFHGIKELRVLGEGVGAEIGASVAYEMNGKVLVPLHDITGSVVSVIDQSGNRVEGFAYTAFGECTSSQNTSITPWRFASKRYDAETGMHFFGRRYYDATLGVWLTQDPLGIQVGPNLYAYVRNNPLTLFDLYGLEEQAERGFFERTWDTVCEVGKAILSGVESLIFNGPHFGDSNRNMSDAINDTIGKDRREPVKPCIYTASGRPTIEALRATQVAGQKSIPVNIAGMLNDNSEAIRQAQFCLALAKQNGYDVEDWFTLALGSDGFTVDIARAYLASKDILTLDTKMAASVLYEFLLQVSQNNPGASVTLFGWSKGGAGACVLEGLVGARSGVAMAPVTIGSPRSGNSGNYVGNGDWVPCLLGNNRACMRSSPDSFTFVGDEKFSWLSPSTFISVHSFTSESYQRGILDFCGKEFSRK